VLDLDAHRADVELRVTQVVAGPGFIGFSLLAHGFTETLCLADINPQAVEACHRTVRDNQLADRVSVYLSDNLTDIAASEEWDLVVGNPPHMPDDYIGDLRTHDEEWHIHRNFFGAVERFLKPAGLLCCKRTIEVPQPRLSIR
jgi:16S rRNA G1207 methylase RsmC